MNGELKRYLEAVERYIKERSPRVFKSPGARFPYPFIDPGSIYDGNLWDWDTFWTVYALMGYSKTQSAGDGFEDKLLESARGNVLNFLAFQQDDGYIPMMVSNNIQGDDEESYLIRKHKEGHVLNMHKPFLCQQIAIISGYMGSFDWISGNIDQLERYFECYDRYYLHELTGLYVWADDVMIGMDNDPATFGRPRFSTANMFLNGFMVLELRQMASILGALGRTERASVYEDKMRVLMESIQRECYDQRDKFFYSQDVDVKTRAYDWFHKGLGVFWHTLPIKVRTWTGFIPLYVGIATKEQAKELVRHIFDEHTFGAAYGVRTLARDEKMYNIEATNNPSNWLGAIWLVTNYVVFRGLMNYGYREEAELIFEKTCALLGRDLETSGDMHEYYDPDTGRPVMSPGFLNWDMLVINMAQELNGEYSVYDYLSGK